MRVRRSSAERSSTCYTPATKGRRPVNSDLSKAGYLDFSSTSSECGSREWVTRQVTVDRGATRGGGESSSSGVVLCRAYSPPSPTRPLLAAVPSRGLLSSRLLVGRWQLFFILKHIVLKYAPTVQALSLCTLSLSQIACNRLQTATESRKLSV